MELPSAHRIARYNYPTRTAAFAYTFLVMGALWIERGRISGWEIALAVLSFLVYPHLAYLHARIAQFSKRAELNNLYADCALLGAWVAQIHFALWPSVGILGALCLNGAGHGHLGRLIRSLLLFCAGAAIWGALTGYAFKPDTGPMVTIACAFGILAYASAVGSLVFKQNKGLVRARTTLENSETQFRFIADRVGDLVAVLDSQGRFIYAGTSHGRYFEPDTLRAGANWLLLVHPDDLDRAKYFLRSIAESVQDKQAHLRLRLPDGTVRSVECHGNPVHIDPGDSKLIVLISRFLQVSENGSRIGAIRSAT